MSSHRVSRRRLLTWAGWVLAQASLSSWAGSGWTSARLPRLAPVRFGIISDPHIDMGGHNDWMMGEASLRCLRETVAALNLAGVDFVLVPGDLLHDGEKHNLTRAREILDTLRNPYFVIAGNHDYGPSDPARRKKGEDYITLSDFIGCFVGHGYDISKKRCWAVEPVQGYRLLALDGCLLEQMSGYGGYLPHEQLVWLEEQLAANSHKPHLIMLHHSLVSLDAAEMDRWFSLENSAAVRRVLEAHRESVVAVLSGHCHVGLRHRRVKGIDYFITPSINSYPMRYTLFQLGGRGICWTSPDVPVEKSLHQRAKKGLLRASWLPDLLHKTGGKALAYYENSRQRHGCLGQKEKS